MNEIPTTEVKRLLETVLGGVEGRGEISDVGLEFPFGDQDISLDGVLAAEGSIEDEADGDFSEVELPRREWQ